MLFRSPGSLVHIGDQKVEEVLVKLWEYDEERCRELSLHDSSDQKQQEGSNWWIEVTGLHEPQLIDALCQRFSLHALLIEDILNTKHRPKIEEYDNAFFVVLKLFSYDSSRKKVETEQVSIVFGDQFTLSFQERHGDPFEQTRERLRNGKGKLRQRGADYLAHRLMDAVVEIGRAHV